MTFEQASQQIRSRFIVPVSLLLLLSLVGVVGAVAGEAEFIIHQFQRETFGHRRTEEKEELDITRTYYLDYRYSVIYCRNNNSYCMGYTIR